MSTISGSGSTTLTPVRAIQDAATVKDNTRQPSVGGSSAREEAGRVTAPAKVASSAASNLPPGSCRAQTVGTTQDMWEAATVFATLFVIKILSDTALPALQGIVATSRSLRGFQSLSGISDFQGVPSRSMAFKRTISTRIQAMIATFAHLPRAMRASYRALKPAS